MKYIRRRWAGVACGLVLGWIGGCQTSSRTPAAPAMQVSDRVFIGTVVSGPTDHGLDISPASSVQLQVRWIALQQLPAEALAPINTQSRLIIAPDSPTALPVSGRLTRPVRFASGDPAAAFADQLQAGGFGPSAEIATDTSLVVPGATVQIGLLPADNTVDKQPLVSLFVAPQPPTAGAAQPSQATIGVQVAGRPATDEPAHGDGSASLWLSRETAIVDAVSLADGSQFVAAVPIKAPNSPWRAIAAVVTVAHTPADPAQLETLRAELEQASANAAAGFDPSPLGDGPTLRSALQALHTPQSMRPALLLLTSLSNARIAGDMVLVADDNALARLSEQTLGFVQPDTPPPLADLRWFLDRSALEFLCQGAQGDALPPELQSVLALHTGDLARRPDAIVELLKQVGSSEALADRLIAENLIALEDSSPAARVRAYDWLAARQRAPADYDPLADARSRRAAIDQAMQQLEGQP